MGYTEHQKRAIAVRAECDPRTVERYLRGEDVRDLSEVRIRRAMVALGWDFPAKQDDAETAA